MSEKSKADYVVAYLKCCDELRTLAKREARLMVRKVRLQSAIEALTKLTGEASND